MSLIADRGLFVDGYFHGYSEGRRQIPARWVTNERKKTVYEQGYVDGYRDAIDKRPRRF